MRDQPLVTGQAGAQRRAIGEQEQARARVRIDAADVAAAAVQRQLVLEVDARREILLVELADAGAEQVVRAAEVEVQVERARRQQVAQVRGVEAVEERRARPEHAADERAEADHVVPRQRLEVAEVGLDAREVVGAAEQARGDARVEPQQLALGRQRRIVAAIEAPSRGAGSRRSSCRRRCGNRSPAAPDPARRSSVIGRVRLGQHVDDLAEPVDLVAQRRGDLVAGAETEAGAVVDDDRALGRHVRIALHRVRVVRIGVGQFDRHASGCGRRSRARGCRRRGRRDRSRRRAASDRGTAARARTATR